jgi:hypothetical protein
MTVRLQRDAHDSVNRCPMTSHMTIISLRGSHIIASLNPVSDDVVIAHRATTIRLKRTDSQNVGSGIE